MVLDQRTKKYLKIFALIAFVFILAGCTNNMNADGTLKASRAITEETKWTLSAGIFDFFLVIPIAKGILFINNLTGNILFGVVGLTIVINIILLPIMIKSTVSSQKMQMLQPEMEKIQNKYKGKKDQTSQLRMQQEIQALYKKNDVSMLGSFSMLLTLPIMLAMWQSVQRVKVLYESTTFGLSLGLTPMSQIQKGHWEYLIIIVIMALSQFLAIEINNMMLKRDKNYHPSKTQNSMKSMNIMMTAMIIFFGMTMPTAMSFYWITTNIITVIRTVYIHIHYIEKEQAKKDENVIR
ncbi:YidC/Oxa1 family membrane protein insertase [Eggerthia catenaformis OT 569 = DSM 20559]|uniref:YidC/Oxa1 family membrane protein insertase n=1 Tax=Eggerthia catenaformis OT 569 = DSM 20559 TaxID=999415 RepID=M2PPY9_9FIRM|nr:YidC/Oxa1 family membrane protein insertase [Eggerthia catenaformis]EMD17644.1 YidC/Oxa1 family membrane protein insertase [Eggerthia catenaformis OT 569 = DSM 20559]